MRSSATTGRASVGTGVFPEDGETIEALLQAADERLLAARRRRHGVAQRRAAWQGRLTAPPDGHGEFRRGHASTTMTRAEMDGKVYAVSHGEEKRATWYASRALHWPEEVSNESAKWATAGRLAATVSDGALIGIGSGSAAYLALWAIGQRVAAESLAIRVVTTSYETEAAACTLGVPTLPLGSVQPDWGVDGADEVDPQGRLLKGRGGAMFMEKVLWATCHRMYLAIDPSKQVERLGQRFPVPIEVHRHAVELVGRELDGLGCSRWGLRLAGGKDGPLVTEWGNLVIDAWYDEIPPGLHPRLKAISGVIETGLFEGYGYEVI